jgi:hypothetical protein
MGGKADEMTAPAFPRPWLRADGGRWLRIAAIEPRSGSGGWQDHEVTVESFWHDSRYRISTAAGRPLAFVLNEAERCILSGETERYMSWKVPGSAVVEVVAGRPRIAGWQEYGDA